MINLVTLIICLIFIVWLFFEPHRIVLKRLKIQDEALKGLKFVFVSDFHIKFYEKNRKRHEKARNGGLCLSRFERYS